MIKEIKYIWEDCVVLIECPYCGYDEFLLDSQNGPKSCPRCGKVFILNAYAEEIVNDKEE
jgi:uncharacterized C2H2 Zn-finger protein